MVWVFSSVSIFDIMIRKEGWRSQETRNRNAYGFHCDVEPSGAERLKCNLTLLVSLGFTLVASVTQVLVYLLTLLCLHEWLMNTTGFGISIYKSGLMDTFHKVCSLLIQQWYDRIKRTAHWFISGYKWLEMIQLLFYILRSNVLTARNITAPNHGKGDVSWMVLLHIL